MIEIEHSLTLKFRYLAEWMRKRGSDGQLISPEEAINLASTIEALLPAIEAITQRPVPPKWRVVQGGRS